MDSFLIALNAVVPFLFYISFGFGVRKSGIVDEAFMKKLNQMVFKAFFPILMFCNLYGKENLEFDLKLLWTGAISLPLLVVVLMLTVPRIVKTNPERGVVIQAIFRSNFVLFAIPLTESIFGEDGARAASMMVAVVVPMYNVLAVLVLEYFQGGKVSAWKMIKKMFSNPLIQGALAGFAFILLKIQLPDCIEKPLRQFSNMTTPLALFVLGGTLAFSSMRKHWNYILSVVFLKLVLIPFLILGITIALRFEPMSRFILLTMYATPVAASSYPMAQNMGGNGALAGELVVITTVLSVLTIFLWVFGLRGIGLI